nr:hypothetical protein [Tanacetum cinerariifolium]
YKVASPAVESFVNSSEILENRENVKSISDKGYHAVPLPYTGNYIPPKPDLMFIDEQVKSDYVDVVSNVASSDVKIVEPKHESVDVKNKGVYNTIETKHVKKNSFSPPIIEDWNSDDESEVEFVPKVEIKTVIPSIEKIKLVKSAREKVEKETNAILLIMMVDLFPLEMVKAEFLAKKEKQHKASYKAKLVNSIKKPLYMLHMDLFGPTHVKSLMKKTYCLVVTMTLVDFLGCDNGTEFKNSAMNQFCDLIEIKREFSVARTPQQNGIAKKKNRILIEAAITMLVDFKLPTTFWAEAVNTACYVLNRALVIKPYNKTPYELIRGRPPLIHFMKPFGCPVTILNTRDHLGKFDRKADKGFFIGYSVVSQAEKKKEPKQEYNLIPICTTNPLISQGPKDNAVDVGKKELNSPVSTVGPSFANTALPSPINVVGTPGSTNAFKEHPFERFSPFKTAFSLPHVPIMTPINDTTILVFRNKKDERGIVVKNKAKLVAQGHTQEDGIDYDEVFTPVARIEAIRLFLAYASFKDFIVYQTDVKSAFLYEKIEDEVYVCQSLGFKDLDFPDKVYKVDKALYRLHQAPRAWLFHNINRNIYLRFCNPYPFHEFIIMTNLNNNVQTQTSNTLHNAIMEAGSKDRPPMLAPAEKIARIANLLALIAQQQPVYHPHTHPTHYNQNSLTRLQQAATKNRGKAIVNSPQPIYDQEPSMVDDDDETSKDKEIDKLMALISLSFKKVFKPTNNNLRTSSNTSRAN